MIHVWVFCVFVVCFPGTHHRDDISSHVREANAAGVESSHQQLAVFISVFMFSHIVSLYHFLLQHND